MSQTLLFEIGAVIFLAVVTALFLYGLAEFKDWQDRDDNRAGTVRDNEHAGTVTAMPVPNETAGASCGWIARPWTPRVASRAHRSCETHIVEMPSRMPGTRCMLRLS